MRLWRRFDDELRVRLESVLRIPRQQRKRRHLAVKNKTFTRILFWKLTKET